MPTNARPSVFISATSADLGSVRNLVKLALLDIGCHPEEQAHFPPDARSIEQMLHGTIDGCVAMIHVAGLRHGVGPAPATSPAASSPSYTQLEYEHGCRLQEERGADHFRVYVFVLPGDFPYDTGTDPEPAEKQAAQRAHRARLLTGARRYESPATPQDLKERVLALREPVLALKRELASGERVARRTHRTLYVVLTLLALALLAALVVFQRVDTGLAEIREHQTIDLARIRTHLREASERALQTDIEEANKATASDVREQQRNAARTAHETRLLRIDDFVASIAALNGQPGIDPVLQEMLRILQDEGLDKALAYVERQRSAILAANDRLQAAHDESLRARLRPLLQAAGLKAARGDDGARQAYAELLARQPQWPELLEAFGWYLHDRSEQALAHGSLRAAQADAAQCIELALRFNQAAEGSLRALALLAAANIVSGDGFARSAEKDAAGIAGDHYAAARTYAETRYKAAGGDDMDAARAAAMSLSKLGDFLAGRGASGDAEQALDHYRRSLQIRDRLLAVNGDNTQIAREVSASLNKLGDFLVTRGASGDAQQAFLHYRRSLEICERLCPNDRCDDQTARDLSISLNKLAGFLAERRQPGDTDQALIYYGRDLDISERLLAANADSVQAARDLSLSLSQLGDFLAARGLPGDAKQSLAHYERSLQMRQDLLADNAGNGQAARDVAISLVKLGDFLAARGAAGDTEQALEYYRQNLEISEDLLIASSGSAQAARDRAASLEKLAGFIAKRGAPGDALQVLAYLEQSLEILEGLLSVDAGSAQLARDVAIGLDKLGDFFMTRRSPGDADQALVRYQRSLEIRERLLAANAGSAQAARDVSVGLDKLGEFLVVRRSPGDTEQAVIHFQRSLQIRERLLAANADSAQAARDVLISLERLAQAQTSDRNGAQHALAFQNRAVTIAQTLRTRDPESLYHGRTLAISLYRAAHYAAAAGDADLARQHRAASLALLDALIQGGATQDATMRRLHAELSGSTVSR